jgi:hypothetical protein
MKITHVQIVGKLKMTLEDGSVEVLNNVVAGIDSPGKITLEPFGGRAEKPDGVLYKFDAYDDQLRLAIQRLDDREDQVKAILEITEQSLYPSDIHSIFRKHGARMPTGQLITKGGVRGAIRRTKNKGKIIANADGTYTNNGSAPDVAREILLASSSEDTLQNESYASNESMPSEFPRVSGLSFSGHSSRAERGSIQHAVLEFVMGPNFPAEGLSAMEVYEFLHSSNVPGVSKGNVSVALQCLSKTNNRVSKVGDRISGVRFRSMSAPST